MYTVHDPLRCLTRRRRTMPNTKSSADGYFLSTVLKSLLKVAQTKTVSVGKESLMARPGVKSQVYHSSLWQ